MGLTKYKEGGVNFPSLPYILNNHHPLIMFINHHRTQTALAVKLKQWDVTPSPHGLAFPVSGVIGKFNVDVGNTDDPAFAGVRKFCINITEQYHRRTNQQ